MASFTLRRFSKPGMLRRIDRKHLIAFLEPHAAYFSARGVVLPPVQQEDGLDYNALSHVLLTPDNSTPDDLAEALFYVNEVCTPEGFDSIQDEIAGTDIDVEIGENAAPADLAIQVWMANREIIEKVHAEQSFMSVRSFEYVKTKANPLPDFVLPSAETLAALEADLDEWFSKKRRGKYSKVFVYPKEGCTWFLVRHGRPYAREAVIESGESTSHYFRPEKFDVLAYNPVIGEIRMSAETKGERELYRKKFGLHLFGDEEFFGERSLFDLEPLRQLGEDSLLCGDVEGIEFVKLKELRLYWGGAYKDVEVRRSEDLFASYRDRDRSLPAGGKIVKATFLVKFKGSKNPRSVTLSSGNRAQFKRDGDAEVIERWLGLRGFIVGGGGVSDE